MAPAEFHLFLPQIQLDLAAIEQRALAAERSGFGGIAFMDHMAAPLAEDRPMYEAMTVAQHVLAATTSLRVGHLVLCDAFRHPVMLARQVVTLDHASGGRFDLGIGAGSVPAELARYDVADTAAGPRVDRLAETLDILRSAWSGDAIEHHGKVFDIESPPILPRPLGDIPVVIGAEGPRMLSLVSRHATWWNLQVNLLGRLDELRPAAGDARVSTQNMVAFVGHESQRAEVEQKAARRFGDMGGGLKVGSSPELVEHFGKLHERGVERFYVWFADFAVPETLEAFGAGVISQL